MGARREVVTCCGASEQDGCDMDLVACAVLAKASTTALSLTVTVQNFWTELEHQQEQGDVLRS